MGSCVRGEDEAFLDPEQPDSETSSDSFIASAHDDLGYIRQFGNVHCGDTCRPACG